MTFHIALTPYSISHYQSEHYAKCVLPFGGTHFA